MNTDWPAILLIEDNDGDALLVRQALTEHEVRCNLSILRDGEQAFAFIDAVSKGQLRCPDLIVLDLNLPKRSGHEVLAKMRSVKACNRVPVVVLSSSIVLADTIESERLGVAFHIQKPADLEEFLSIGAVLKSLLPGKAGGSL